jgi:hypothetical protein
MASIHISEIQKFLFDRGELDAYPPPKGQGGFFLEIRFDQPNRDPGVIDEEFKDKVLTADCAVGTVTIQFDSNGELRTIDMS